jgi:hypothetical protein
MLAVLVATHYPSNHVSFDPRWLAVLPAAGLVVAATLRFTPWKVVAILLGIAALEAPFVLESRNYLVHYDRWVRRGMPAFGQH